MFILSSSFFLDLSLNFYGQELSLTIGLKKIQAAPLLRPKVSLRWKIKTFRVDFRLIFGVPAWKSPTTPNGHNMDIGFRWKLKDGKTVQFCRENAADIVGNVFRNEKMDWNWQKIWMKFDQLMKFRAAAPIKIIWKIVFKMKLAVFHPLMKIFWKKDDLLWYSVKIF